MRVLLAGSHRYPADPSRGVGLRPTAMPSGSGGHIHDLLARGLAELGHDVRYLLRLGATEALPPGVRRVDEPDDAAEIYHSALYGEFEVDPIGERFEASGRAWVTTCHIDRRSRGGERRSLPTRTIYVSPTLARAHSSTRFVWNGLDPTRYTPSTRSPGARDYLLFVSALEHAWDKGLDIAIDVAQRTGMRLVVAGSARTLGTIDEVTARCPGPRVECVGDVRGLEKARLYGDARALLCPSRLNEGCPLAIIEALMSGTPVIASRSGACPDMVTPDVGVVCDTADDYVRAVEGIGAIDPETCRRLALERFHYRRMTEDYLREYQRELAPSPTLVGTRAAVGAGRDSSRR